MRPAIRVKYKGKRGLLTFFTANHGMSIKAGYQKWVRIGRPDILPGDFFEVDLRKLANLKKGGYTLNGSPVTLDVIAYRLGVTVRQACIIAKTQGRDFRTVKAAPRLQPLDRSPGWWERENLSSSGENGFCKSTLGNGGLAIGYNGKLPTSI